MFSEYLNICLDFSITQKKQLDWKDNANFKSYDVTIWLTNSYNATYCPIFHNQSMKLEKDNQSMKLSQLMKYNK